MIRAMMIGGSAVVGAALLAAAAVPAHADGMYYGQGVKDVVEPDVPAPVPVPAPMPSPEGHSYYLRGDLGWAIESGGASFGESGNLFGNGPGDFTAKPPFAFGAPEFTSDRASIDGAFFGTLGIGAYLLPHLRGDLTIDLRSPQTLSSQASYSYASTAGPGINVNGTVNDKVTIHRVVGLANLYYDFLPPGRIQPYIGGGLGFVYNDLDWNHVETATAFGPSGPISSMAVQGVARDYYYGLAGALTGGVAFQLDHHWTLDLNYRALYTEGASAGATFTNGVASKGTISDQWENQLRLGLRLDIW